MDEAEIQVVNEIVNSNVGFVFSSSVPLTRSERRRAEHVHVIQVTLMHAPTYAVWTPAQRQAVGFFYELGMPQARAAKLLGITRQVFGKRLSRAEENAQRWYDRYGPTRRVAVRHREKKGRPDARLTIDGTVPEDLSAPAGLGWLGKREPRETVAQVTD